MSKAKWFETLKNWLAPDIEEIKNSQLKCEVNTKSGRLILDVNSVRESKEVQKQLDAIVRIFEDR